MYVTQPYNADFDGDEMNMHTQSLNSFELKYLSNVNTQIINPLNSSPIIVLVQDAKLGIHYITKKQIIFLTLHLINNNQ